MTEFRRGEGTPPADGMPPDEGAEAIREVLAEAKVVSLEEVRSKKQEHGPTVGAGDKKSSPEQAEKTERGLKQCDRLIELSNAADLFRTADGSGLADLNIKGHPARPGLFAAKGFDAGSRGASSRRPAVRPTQKRCNRR